MKANDIDKDIVEDVENRFVALNSELYRPLNRRKNKKVIRLMKGELAGKIMSNFVGLRAETYSYLIDDGSKDGSKVYNPNKKWKILIVFDDMIADMLSNKKLNKIVTESFIRSRKLSISLVFITQSCFKVPKDFILNTTHFLLRKFQANKNLNKLHGIIYQILTLKTLWICTKKCTAKQYSYLVIDDTIASDNSSRFRKNLLVRIYHANWWED